MDIIHSILNFIISDGLTALGGGLVAILGLRYAKKKSYFSFRTSELDYERRLREKYIELESDYKNQLDSIRTNFNAQISDLKVRIEQLEKLKCLTIECEKRISMKP